MTVYWSKNKAQNEKKSQHYIYSYVYVHKKDCLFSKFVKFAVYYKHTVLIYRIHMRVTIYIAIVNQHAIFNAE